LTVVFTSELKYHTT